MFGNLLSQSAIVGIGALAGVITAYVLGLVAIILMRYDKYVRGTYVTGLAFAALGFASLPVFWPQWQSYYGTLEHQSAAMHISLTEAAMAQWFSWSSMLLAPFMVALLMFVLATAKAIEHLSAFAFGPIYERLLETGLAANGNAYRSRKPQVVRRIEQRFAASKAGIVYGKATFGEGIIGTPKKPGSQTE